MNLVSEWVMEWRSDLQKIYARFEGPSESDSAKKKVPSHRSGLVNL